MTSNGRIRYRTIGATFALAPLALAVRWLTPLDAAAATIVVALPVVLAGSVLALDAGPPLRRFSDRSGVGPAVGAGAWLLVAAGFGAANWLGDPVVLCPDPAPPRCITLYGWASAGFVGGVFALALAVGSWPLYRRVTGPAIEGAGDSTPGPVALRGTVEPAGETVRSPVAGRDAVCCRWAVAERAGGMPGDQWTTVATGEAAVPFYVSDATGRMLVDPADGDLRPAVHRSTATTYPVDDAVTVEAGEALPESVQQFRREREADGPAGTFDGAGTEFDGPADALDGPADVDRKYQETRIEPSDPVFVVGEAVETRRVEYPERVVVAGHDGAAPPAVFAGSPEDVRGALRLRVVAGAALGLLLGVPGLAAMLALAAV